MMRSGFSSGIASLVRVTAGWMSREAGAAAAAEATTAAVLAGAATGVVSPKACWKKARWAARASVDGRARTTSALVCTVGGMNGRVTGGGTGGPNWGCYG